jgi:hypothetical protein
MSNPDECTILAGLLDFYSDKATAHASFVVAATFGIYTFIFSTNKVDIKNLGELLVFFLIYCSLLGFDLYSFFNFSKYASISHLIRTKLIKHMYESSKKYSNEISSLVERDFPMVHTYIKIIGNPYFVKLKPILLGMGIFLTTVLPLIYVILYVWT